MAPASSSSLSEPSSPVGSEDGSHGWDLQRKCRPLSPSAASIPHDEPIADCIVVGGAGSDVGSPEDRVPTPTPDPVAAEPVTRPSEESERLPPSPGPVEPDTIPPETSAQRKRPAPTPKKTAAPTAKRRKKAWEAPYVYTSPNSPLVKKNVDIRALLCNPLAWDGLSPTQQQALLPLFPPEFVLDGGTEKARPNTQAMLNSDDFRHDCAQYLTNLRLGRHEPEWILQAQEAHLKRADGDFDSFLRARFRDDWGVEPPEDYPERRRVAAAAAAARAATSPNLGLNEENDDKGNGLSGDEAKQENGGDRTPSQLTHRQPTRTRDPNADVEITEAPPISSPMETTNQPEKY